MLESEVCLLKFWIRKYTKIYTHCILYPPPLNTQLTNETLQPLTFMSKHLPFLEVKWSRIGKQAIEQNALRNKWSHGDFRSSPSENLNISRPRGLWGFSCVSFCDGRSQGWPAQARVYKFPDRDSLRGLTTANELLSKPAEKACKALWELHSRCMWVLSASCKRIQSPIATPMDDRSMLPEHTESRCLVSDISSCRPTRSK